MRTTSLVLALALAATTSALAKKPVAPPSAEAASLDLEHVEGLFSNALGAPDTTVYLDVDNEAQVRWGIDGGFGQSGLGFQGNVALPLQVIPSEEFEIGTLRHFNNPVFPPTVASVDLGITLVFTDAVSTRPFTFNFQITETTNVDPCEFPSDIPCADRIAFPNAVSNETLQWAGRTIALEIIGFRTEPGGPILSEFISNERRTNSAILVGRLRVLSGGCTYTQGYWKNHAADWRVSSLMLGDRSYTQAELLRILKQPVKGNGLVSLAHQLIAAKLNRASYAAIPDPVDAAIASSDELIDTLVVPPIGAGQLSTSATSMLVSLLDEYNNGLFRDPPHCR